MARPTLLRLGWFVFAALTAAAMAGLLRQQVDAENRALKIPDGVEARRLAELAQIVPDDPVVLLAFVARGDLLVLDRDLEQLRALAGELSALVGVRECQVVPTPDPGVVVLPVQLDDGLDGRDPFAVAQGVVAAARSRAPATLELHATGLPLIEGRIASLVAGERTTIVPALLVVLLAAAWVGYRRLSLAVAVLLPAIAAIAWTGGLVAWLGHRLDPVAALLDPVLLTIGVAASVHFVEAFRRARAAGEPAAAAADAARRELRRPAFWAATTTMLGLWSLTINDTPAVVDFGVRAAFGVALTHLFTFTLLPAWLRGVVRDAAVGPARGAARIGPAWVRRLLRFRLWIVAATAAAITLAATGLGDLRSENDPLDLLPADEPVRVDHELLTARLGGVETAHLMVSADSPATEPSRLLPYVAAMRVGAVTAGLAGPVVRGVEGGLAVPLLLRPAGSTARARGFDDIDEAARVLGLDGVHVAGPSVQIARDSVALIDGLLGSLLLSLFLLTSAMAIGLGSLRLGVFAMVPNLLPSLWVYGGLGVLGRPLSVATAMIGCTMLGLIVDNTLHLLHHYREARRSEDGKRALEAALDRCGRAITLSAGVLMLGFATAALSRLSTTVEFALLATATIAMAWFGTAVLLPTLLLSRRAREEREEVVDAR